MIFRIDRYSKDFVHKTKQKGIEKIIFPYTAIIFSRTVAVNLGSFVVPLRMIPKIHKNNRNKTDTCLERWGVGDTHFTGSHIGGIHISLGICVRGYTYHGDTHITGGDNGEDGRTDERTVTWLQNCSNLGPGSFRFPIWRAAAKLDSLT